MRFHVVIYSVGVGGVERSLSVLTRYWTGRHDVKILHFLPGPPFYSFHAPLLCLSPERGDRRMRFSRRLAALRRLPSLFRALPPPARKLLGGLRGSLWPPTDASGTSIPSLLQRALALAEFFDAERPEHVLGMGDRSSLAALLAARICKRPPRIVVSNHVHLGHFEPPLREIIQSLFPEADEVLAVSEELRQALVQEWGVPAGKCRTTPNPLDGSLRDHSTAPVDLDPVLRWLREGPSFLTVARLVHQKGLDRLLRAFARVPGDPPPRLVILGEGPERAPLERLAQELGIESRMRMPGAESNPFPYYAAASAFVLSSRQEGNPIVLGEAMLLGCPVISFACPTGPREVLRDGECGLLVPEGDVPALAEAMTRVLRDPALRRELADRGRRRAEDFLAEKVGPLWIPTPWRDAT